MAKSEALNKSAFVTLVMQGDGYIPGALMLGYSLRRQNKDFNLICMVTSDVSDYSRDVLKLFYNDVIEVDKIFVPCKRMKETHYLPYVFTKINALKLCKKGLLKYDLDKVVFIDSDVLPLSNYEELFEIDAPAGIINEFKSHLTVYDDDLKYVIKDEYFKTGKWHWHEIYDKVCPHGQPIPKDITDRVIENQENMGIHGAVMIMKPSVDEFDSIIRDIEQEETKNRILQYSWPEMQYLTVRWSGQWRNIDIKYSGFKGFPSMELLYGTHFAGVKPWKIVKSNYNLYKLPDYKIWFDMFIKMYEEYKKELSQYKKFKTLAQAIQAAKDEIGK